MAVQAQYPSNVLFLNRSVQEGKGQIGNNHSSLVVVQTQQQQEPSGVFGEESFLDPTQMLFNPGVRVRKHTSATTTTTEARNPLMSIQSQPQLINIIQDHNNSSQQHQQQTNVVSAGLQLTFGNQFHHHQQHTISHLYPHQSSLDDYLASHIKQQQHEIDHFLQVQGEQLRRTLVEKRKRHYHALIGAVQESTARRLKEKETEVENASRRNTELEARASQLIGGACVASKGLRTGSYGGDAANTAAAGCEERRRWGGGGC